MLFSTFWRQGDRGWRHLRSATCHVDWLFLTMLTKFNIVCPDQSFLFCKLFNHRSLRRILDANLTDQIGLIQFDRA